MTTGASDTILTSINDRLSELREDVRSVRTHVDAKVGEVMQKIDTLPDRYISKDTFNAVIDGLQTQISDLNNQRNKVTWLVLSTVIIAILGLVVVSGSRLILP